MDNIMYIRRTTALKLDFAFKTISKTAGEIALIDSRATENLIDIDMWKALNIGLFDWIKQYQCITLMEP